jgi:signal transduction histidine kinase/ActR/RegA family two-component response regulator
MMLGWLQRLPSFGAKVTWALTSIGGLAVLVVSIALVGFSYFNLRSELHGAVEAQARLVAMNSSAPLAFEDPVSGRQALAAMSASPHIGSATVFDTRGIAFARFERREKPAPMLPLELPGLHRSGDWQVLTLPIDESGERLGFVQVAYDLDLLYRRLLDRLLASLLVAAAAMLVIYGISRAIRGVLVGPVDELAQVAREVSQTRNYGLRVRRLSNDETGQAADAFNEMLARIQQQHADLQAARREAERASQMKDDFLATLSHELRTPMAPILGWAQILMRGQPDAGRVRQGAEIIERNARIQTQIIDDLLDMSRIVSGKLLLRSESMNLRAVCEAALATVQPSADARGVLLESELETVPWLRGDPNRLQQVVWNLLANGIKFTPRGGRVELRLRRDGDAALIEVRDSGQGIAADFLPHVFERFRQADSSTTRAHGGLGIGLAITRQLVELHGGAVQAASEGEGRGATFTVRLPLPAAERSEDVARPDPGLVAAALPLQGARLLVVDDDADGRELLAQVLGEAGAAVDTATCAEEALALLCQRRHDVLVSDIGMPGVDGYELLARLRRLPAEEGGQTPAIALTAFARNEDRERALLAGFQQHLGKPVETTQLIAAVSTLLRRARPVG